MNTVVSPVGFAFFISPELFYTANTSIKDSQVKHTVYSVCEGKREMEQSHHLSHSRYENCPDLCTDPSCLPNPAKTPLGAWTKSGCGTRGCHAPVGQGWIHAAVSLNLSSRFQSVVSKSLIQAHDLCGSWYSCCFLKESLSPAPGMSQTCGKLWHMLLYCGWVFATLTW